MHDATPRTLQAEAIARRLPHAGRMCLLQAMLHADAQSILCEVGEHRSPEHPLRAAGGLGASAAIEFAAQAMALHATLAQGPEAPARPGFLASARRVRLHVARLDDQPGPLQVRAERVAGDHDQALYAFSLKAGDGRLLVEGRVSVVLGRAPGVPLHTRPQEGSVAP